MCFNFFSPQQELYTSDFPSVHYAGQLFYYLNGTWVQIDIIIE